MSDAPPPPRVVRINGPYVPPRREGISGIDAENWISLGYAGFEVVNSRTVPTDWPIPGVIYIPPKKRNRQKRLKNGGDPEDTSDDDFDIMRAGDDS